MKWMIKCWSRRRCSCSFLTGPELFVAVSSSCQFGAVLPVVDVCPDIGVDHLVLCVRDAGEGVDGQHCVYGQQSTFWQLYDMLMIRVGAVNCVVQYDQVRRSAVGGTMGFHDIPRAPLNVIPAWIVQILQVCTPSVLLP
jgi:hypothetical protein